MRTIVIIFASLLSLQNVQNITYHFDSHIFFFTLKIASAQVVETSLTNNSPPQDSNHPDDLFQSRHFFYLVFFGCCIFLIKPSRHI